MTTGYLVQSSIIDDLVDTALEKQRMSVAKDTVTVKFNGNVVDKAESLTAYVGKTSNQAPLELEWKVEGKIDPSIHPSIIFNLIPSNL